jgi:DNA-binding LacI/PurR family transcriptional regulator
VDVAEAAGTSAATASRILNGAKTFPVSEDLRRRVVQAARELGYRPHAAARSLRMAQAGAVGMLVPTFDNPVYAQLIGSAFARAAEQGVTMLLAEDSNGEEAGEALARLVPEGRIDGVIVGSVRAGHSLPEILEEHHVPHVFMNRAVRGSGRNVIMDDARATVLAVDHLFGLGHRRIAHVAGPLDIDPAARRAEAFERRTWELGLAHTVVSDEFLEVGGVRAFERLWATRDRCTAVYTSTVSQAVGVISAASKHRVEIPRQLSVIAHADMPLAEFLVPPLTAIRVPLVQLAAVAVDALLEQIRTGATADVVVDDEPELMSRASTAPPP